MPPGEPVTWDEVRRRRVVGLCAAISGDRSAAEDLAQETFLEAWRHGHKLTDPDGVDRWLAAIARNVCHRWRRRTARDAVAELRDEPAHADLELFDLVGSGLDGLTPSARDVLVRRYVDDAPLAEIATALQISEDAVSMRLTRAKNELRQLLAPQPSDAWQSTRIWCADCGRATMLRRVTAEAIQFSCSGCDDGAISHDIRLANPVLARLVAGVARPSTILSRLAEWSRLYFDSGVGMAACTRCGEPVAIARDPDRRGLRADCGRCGEAVSTSLRGIAVSQPHVRRFRREHTRAHIAAEWAVERDGIAADVVRFQDRLGRACVDVVVARDTLRVLS